MTSPSKPYFAQAIDALKAGDRKRAALLIGRELRDGNTSPKNLRSVVQLAGHIGEINLAIEASRRSIEPRSLESLLAHWATLATYNRSDEAVDEIRRQPAAVRDHPSVVHYRATVASQFGQFEQAEHLFRDVLRKEPTSMQTWFSLAMLKRFEPGDADIEAMDRLDRRQIGPPEARASLHHALGKAYEDTGDIDRAFNYYSSGAALRRQQLAFDMQGYGRAAECAMREFTREALDSLRPSGFHQQRTLFVTGLPRSGTTLTEEMLVRHFAVAHGGELNLTTAALIPTLGNTIDGARAYEKRSTGPDPWGEIGRDYAGLVDQHFRSPLLAVDKSLGQSLLTGLLLHASPDARIAWLRRSPDDVALSCFRNYFATGLKWTWSLADIAQYMRIEDRLFAHWTSVFGDRILTVPYEELVRNPAAWEASLQQHFGLQPDVAGDKMPPSARAITTASSVQVRQPISTARIGQAAKFERHLKPFRDLYYD